MSPMKALHLRLPPPADGWTLTRALHESGGISHAVAKGIIDHRLVRVNGTIVSDPAHRLRAGDRLVARFDPRRRYRERACAGKSAGFRIVREDADLLIVDKDPGLLTVPTPTCDDALTRRVLSMYAGRGLKRPRLWVIHRIDRFSSGLVLFGRSDQAAFDLIRQFQRRRVRREYLALCEGIPRPPCGRIASRLIGGARGRKVRETRASGRGRPAVSFYRTEEKLHHAALVRVSLETGRRNQIRVQFAGMGNPLLGDRAYSRPSELIDRVALHAAKLAFEHPRSGRTVEVTSPLPPDMRRALISLRLG